jgi:hypothetical protein
MHVTDCGIKNSILLHSKHQQDLACLVSSGHLLPPLCLPQDVSLQDAAAALSPSGVYGYSSDLQVQLDALLGLSCLLSSGSTHNKLQLCFWALDRCAAAAAVAGAHGCCN